MKKQIRYSVFETNSSSVHSLSYRWPKYMNIEDYLDEHGKYGRLLVGYFSEVEEAETSESALPCDRLNWLIGVLLNSEEVEVRWYLLKLMDYMNKLGVDMKLVEPFYNQELRHYYRYVDKELIEDIFSSESKFLTFIFDPTCVVEESPL